MTKVSADTLLPIHVKAARALIGWSAADLAANCCVGAATVRLMESGGKVRDASRQAIIDGLEAARIDRDNGVFQVRLLNGGEPGARLMRVKG